MNCKISYFSFTGYVLVPDSVSITKENKISSLSKYDLNVQLLDQDRPVTLSGLKRRSSKTVFELEEDVRRLTERIEALEKEHQSGSRIQHMSSSKLDESLDLSDEELNSSSFNDSFPQRSKSGKLSTMTDIAYLYSVPLVRDNNGKIESMGLPIDHNTEIEDIIEGLENTNKMVNFRIDIANKDNLNNMITVKPKIVHLSCHGDIDKDGSFYLAFESKKTVGMMEKLTESQLKILFKNQKDMNSIEAMIVSACHSQKIGELMMESGIPVVIAINAPFKIQDEAARTFGKAFHSALVQGSSYEEAYKHAKSSVAGSLDPHSIYS